MPSWAKSSSAPATPKVSPRRHLAWAQESSGQVGQGCGRVPEMTWSFASPDGRVTFEIVTDDDEPWIRWRRVGESRRLQARLIRSRRSGRAASEGGWPTTLLWSGLEHLGEDAGGPPGAGMETVEERVGPYRCSSAALLVAQVDEQCVCLMWTSPPPDTWAGSDLRK